MNNNLVLELNIKALKKMCIGSGGLAVKTKADITFLRISDQLLIPASTIKGILRTSMIKIAPLLGYTINYSVYPNQIIDDANDIVISLMGKPNSAGKVRVSSAILSHDTFTLTHVTINDKTRNAKEGQLFNVEYLPKDVEFVSEVRAYNISIEEARVLFTAIAEMNYERFGRSGGLVTVRISNNSQIPDQLRHDHIVSRVLEVTMR